ncbi:MAG TPA: T9SS type A sorting domain-containing protein, partial [Flavipsychrobacter sp.]|nr:T9SS type A sorting domain-containing protein [Flavipsychrobacter sp.]
YIRKVDTYGIISTIAGSGVSGSNGDWGPALNAEISPGKVAIDKVGNIYFAEQNFNKVRKLRSDGLIEPIAGNGNNNSSGDGGVAVLAELSRPAGVAVDSCGNLYICEAHGFRVRKVDFNPPCFPLNITNTTPLTFTLSPNPTTGHIKLISKTGTTKGNVQITNLNGQIVYQTDDIPESGDLQLPLPDGMYILRYSDPESACTQKLFIKR